MAQKVGRCYKKLNNRNKSLKYFKSQNNQEAQAIKVMKEIIPLSFEFQELAEQSAMYANTGTHSEIVKVISYMNSLTSNFEVASDDLENKAHPFNLSLNAMSAIYDLIARDMREMMGLGKISEHAKLP